MTNNQTANKSELAPKDGDGESHITMEMLYAVDREESLSQRSLAAKLNIALGLTNAYLKRCVRMGFIKVRKIPPNRYAYYLTPKGFGEKSRLAANYLLRSFDFYRRARNQCDELLEAAADNGYRRISLVGASELAEIALLCALQHDVEIVGVADENATANRFRHINLVRNPASLPDHDIIIVCDLNKPQETFEKLAEKFGADSIWAPPLLNIPMLDISSGKIP